MSKNIKYFFKTILVLTFIFSLTGFSNDYLKVSADEKSKKRSRWLSIQDFPPELKIKSWEKWGYLKPEDANDPSEKRSRWLLIRDFPPMSIEKLDKITMSDLPPKHIESDSVIGFRKISSAIAPLGENNTTSKLVNQFKPPSGRPEFRDE